jgi:hypothetical protein
LLQLVDTNFEDTSSAKRYVLAFAPQKLIQIADKLLLVSSNNIIYDASIIPPFLKIIGYLKQKWVYIYDTNFKHKI